MIAGRARFIVYFKSASKFIGPSSWHQAGQLPRWNAIRTLATTGEPGPNESTPTTKGEGCEPGVTVEYNRGLPHLTVPLPSRRERCVFTLRPVTHCVGDLVEQIRAEDKGVDRVAVKTIDGTRIASSNSIESLMENDFDLIVNDVTYRVKTPTRERLTQEELERLSDVQNLVMQLYEALHVGEHQLKKERHLLSRLEDLQSQLLPLERKKDAIVAQVERRTTVLTWTGLTLMAVQFGALARLTWWEYSWDIMEPVTYFVTYGTSMACFAYYVLTKQEYVLPDVRDREFLVHFHKKAKRLGVDVDEYNRLKDDIARVENDLRRLRDPLRIHYPHHFKPGGGGGCSGSLADHEDHASNQRVIMASSLWDRANVRLQNLFRSARP